MMAESSSALAALRDGSALLGPRSKVSSCWRVFELGPEVVFGACRWH